MYNKAIEYIAKRCNNEKKKIKKMLKNLIDVYDETINEIDNEYKSYPF